MPIAFPQKPRGRPAIQAANLIQKPYDYVPAPNMGNPNYRFNADTLGSGRGKIFQRLGNSWNPGVVGNRWALAPIDKRPQFLRDNALWKEIQGKLNMVLAYSSLDNTGADLAACRVMVFRTEDMSFVGEVTSDANGDWSMPMMKGGPFFFVEYKAGVPDRAGTSLNTLVPIEA